MDLPDGWTTGTVSANGIDLQYYRTGSGPPIVMAHAFYANGRCWEPLVDDLMDDYDVVTYDARGHGQSDAPKTGYGIGNRVADLVGLINELDIDDPILLGHSMGASSVAWTAAEYPNLPRALVLEDPVGIHDDPHSDPDTDMEEAAANVREQVRRRANQSVEEAIDSAYEEFDPDWARRLAIASGECGPQIAEYALDSYPKPLRDVFPDIKCPTLVLRSDVDTERRTHDLEAVDSLADGRVIHIPGAGHYVFHDKHDAAYTELRAFLQRV